MAPISRRDILTVTASGAAGLALASGAAAQTETPGAGSKGRSLSDPGPRNPNIERDNPEAFAPPPTDKGDLPNFKYAFQKEFNRQQKGGWARQVTVKDLPIAKEVAGVDMRLEAGAYRELHWHMPAEWAYMLNGTARITAIDNEGRHFAADVKEGDLWYFASGFPHSIQGLGPDGCEFLLAFDDGKFSEDSTFLITDWFAHTPKEVLAKNFGVAESAFDKIPKEEKYIFPGQVPGPLAADLAQSRQPRVLEPMNYELLKQEPIRTRGGTVRIVDSHNFKASKTIAAALVEVYPGAMRELHWHPNADEWQYYISGHGRMTVFASSSKAHTEDFTAGDVGYVERSNGHYIENTGTEVLKFLEIFKADTYMDVSLQQWMANTPREVVEAHLNLPPEVLDRLSQAKHPVVPA
jgi:oxalate decarboxylase